VTENIWIISQVLCDILIFAYIFEKEIILTSTSIFSPNQHEKNVKGGLVATQDQL